MSKFGTVFKSLDSLRTIAANTDSIAKSVDVVVEHLSSKRAVYSHAATQSLAKSLRSASTGGFWGAVRDQRYDEAVIESLAKSGAEPAQIGAFLSSAHGNQLGVSLCAGMAKTMGISSHVRKTFGQWSAALAPQQEPVRKGLRQSVGEKLIAKNNPYHATDGKFASGGGAATRSEGKGAVTTTTTENDEYGVPRVVLRSTIGGKPVTLKMKPETMEAIRNGTLKPSENFAPEKWGAGGENPKREEFDAANGYTPAAEMKAKYDKDSDAVRLNGDLGKKLARSWTHMENASNFAPGEAIRTALTYKAEENAKHAASDIVPELNFAKAHDGTHPVPLVRTGGVSPEDNLKSVAKDYPFSLDHQIETDKGAVGVTLRYSHTPGYKATATDPAAGPEMEFRTFVNEKGHPPFELDTSKVPGLDQKLTDHILNEHESEHGTR